MDETIRHRAGDAVDDRGATARRRVLFLHTATMAPLGADTWVHVQLLRCLDRSTHEVHVACAPGRPGAPTPTFDAMRGIPDVRIVRADLGPPFSWKQPGRVKLAAMMATIPAVATVARLGWHIRRHRIGIVHTTDRARDAATAVVLARLTRSTSIVHVHVACRPWMSGLQRWALRHADVLVAVSDFVARSLVEAGHRPERVHVVRNGIDPADWQPGWGRADARAELRIAPDVPVVITVCRLFPEKGVATLVRAVAAMRCTHPDVVLLVVGDDMTGGVFVRELEELVDELGLAGNIVFTGRRDDVRRLMAAADVFAMPSFEEPFGLVFLEAMAMKLPVVGLDNGGTREIVEHGSTGLLAPPGDVDAVAAHLLALLDAPDARTVMGERGRHAVEEHFTTSRQAIEMARVYALVG